MLNLEATYERLLRTPSDINEHLPVLRKLASLCPVVMEFGVRNAVSTVALLLGHPRQMFSVDINESPVARFLEENVDGFGFYIADSLMIPSQASDLLFLDTYHTYRQLKGELERHGDGCRKFIVMHDTQLFGDAGECGGEGINRAWREWLEARIDKWYLFYQTSRNNGLTVLARRDADLCPGLIDSLPGQ